MSLRLLPRPKFVSLGRITVQLPPQALHFSSRARPQERVLLDLFAERERAVEARDLAVELGDCLGLAWGPGPFQGAFERALESLDRVAGSLPDQAYAVEITPQAAVAVARGEAGLFYAAQTLLELRGRDSVLPCGSIADAPALRYRGLLWDVSRGQVPTLQTLKTLVDLLASLKLNLLTFNLEHTFAFQKHPAIGRGYDPLQPEEIRELVQYARPRQVEVVPAQQSLGHLYHVLKLPEYRHLAYDQTLLWSLDPAREESYQLLSDLYDELIPCFDSAWFNVCCDEPLDLSKHFDPNRFGGRSFPQVYLDHLLRLKAILDRRGKTMMVWGDMLLSHPEMLTQLPKDIVVLDWKYGSGALEGPGLYRATVEPIVAAGLKFLTCTCSWNLMKIFTNLDLLAQNHRAFIPEGIKRGSLGNIVTHWGDLGHMSLLGPTLPALALAAEWSWTGEERAEADLDRAYSAALFGDEQGRVGRLMRQLHEVNRILAGPAGLGVVGFILFFDEPLCGDMIRGLSEPALKAEALGQLADQAGTELPKLLALPLRNLGWLQDLELPIIQLRVLALKIELMARFNRDYPALAPGEPDRVEEVLNELGHGYTQLQELYGEAAAVLERRWLAQAKRSDLDLNLQRYAKVKQACLKRSGQFQKILEDYRASGQLRPWLAVMDAPEFKEYKFDSLAEMGIKHLLAPATS